MSSPPPTWDAPVTREVTVPVATVWRSPAAPRDVDEPACRDLPDVSGWTDSMDREVRLGLHGRTETQLLLGEPVLVLERDGGWSRVAAPWQRSSQDEHGYPGWVRTAHLGSPAPARRGPAATVVARSATCLVAGTQIELSFGTRLGVESLGASTATLSLPGDRRGEVSLHDLRLGSAPEDTYDGDHVLAAARQFLGLRYLWGGTSTWGLDCSGLVQLTWRSFGVLVPRDAHDQAAGEAVDEVPLDEVRPGDLYFFARPGERVYHVGFVTRPVAADGTRWMLHAPEGGELVEDAPLTPHRVDTLVSAGRVRVPDAPRLPALGPA